MTFRTITTILAILIFLSVVVVAGTANDQADIKNDVKTIKKSSSDPGTDTIGENLRNGKDLRSDQDKGNGNGNGRGRGNNGNKPGTRDRDNGNNGNGGDDEDVDETEDPCPLTEENTTSVSGIVSFLQGGNGNGNGSSKPKHNFLLTSEEGDEYVISTAPWWYWEANYYFLAEEDTITVTGWLCLETEEEDERPTIVVQQIFRDEIVMVFRDETGHPLWNGTRQDENCSRDPALFPELEYNATLETTYQGTIVDLTVTCIVPGTYPAYILNIEEEDVEFAVLLSPYWYLFLQEFGLPEDIQSVSVTGMPYLMEDGREYILARSVLMGEIEIILRDQEGWPFWVAFRPILDPAP